MTLYTRALAGVGVAAALWTGAFAQEADTAAPTMSFTAKILDTEQPGSSDITVSGDIVIFRLYYVDVTCTKYEYLFKQEGATLAIRRVTTPPETCEPGSGTMYGVDGQIAGVPPGKYLLELRSVIKGHEEMLYHDVVVVKKKGGTSAAPRPRTKGK